MGSLLSAIRTRFFDKSNKPLTGGKVYTYEANTTTPKTTWSDEDLTTPNANPVILDNEGTALIFLSGNYRIRVEDSEGVLIEDNPYVKSLIGFGAITAGIVQDEGGKNQQEINDDQIFKNNQIQSAIDKGADDTGATDATVALASLLDPAGKYVIQLTKGTYLTDGIVIPPNRIVYANGATFKRKNYSGKPVIDVQEGSIIFGAVVEGNKDALGVGGVVADQGIRLRDNAKAIFCVSDNNRSHGITARTNSTLVMSENQQILFCKTSNNGFNPGASGTADGINVLNSNNALVFGCQSFNNARTNFVAETYNGNLIPEDKHDVTFSTGVKFQSCKSSGAGYGDYNAEMVTSPTFIDVQGGYISFRGSLYTTIALSNLGQIYGENADYTKISNTQLINNTRSNDILYLVGKSPKVNNVDIQIGASVTLTNTTVSIQDSTNYNGEVHNISVNRANNGMNLRVSSASGLRVDSATNIKFFIGRTEGATNVTNFKGLTDKKLEVYSAGLPAQGAWNKNDIVWNTFFSSTSKTMAWICTTSGVFGGTPPVFEAVTIMSRAVAVPNAAGANPTKAEFDALLTALRNSGQLST